MQQQLRVASLLPSATDTLVTLGCASWVVARSHEVRVCCFHTTTTTHIQHQCDDEAVAAAPVVTSSKLGDMPSLHDTDECMSSMSGALRSMAAMSTSPAAIVPLLSHGLAVYQVDLDALKQLRPDVVLTQVQDMAPEDKDEQPGPGPSSQRVARVEAALALLWGYHPKVVHLAANTLQECWADMTAIADALGVADKGRRCVASLQQQMQWVRDACRGRARPEVVCVQWLHPWYSAGSWVPECLEAAGGRPLLCAPGMSVPFYLPQLAVSGAEVLVFAICGLDLQTSMEHVRSVLQQLKQTNMCIAVVDGTKVLSRPGPLLVPSVQVLAEILHHTEEMQEYGHGRRLWEFVEPAHNHS